MPRFEMVFPPVCVEEGCDALPQQGPYCYRHYNKLKMRRWRYGTTELRPKPTDEERFLARLDKTEECWLWQGYLDWAGYGSWLCQGIHMRPHRWAYEHWVGPIPKGMQIDHMCRIRHCVNPLHLRIVTPQENAIHRASYVTHCPQGHPYNEENTSWTGTRRRCRQCNRDRSREYQRALYARGEDTVENRRKRACPEGHPYPPAQRGVKRVCQPCMTLRTRERRGSSLGDAPIAAPNANKTHCPHGHAYDAANTYVTKDGGRKCRTCSRDREREKYRAKHAAPPD